MLEAGAEGVPVVCFADSGGAAEFVRDDAGLIAPYLDVPAFADCVQRLREAPELRRRCGAVAARRVRAEYSLEAQAPRLLFSIQRQLAAREDGRSLLVPADASRTEATAERVVERQLD
jgi:glycosyltransferase involved in cell wall biosynthesis